MQNRRRDYRHSFAPPHRLKVRLTSNNGKHTIDGDMLDLSVGGFCIQSDALKQASDERWEATIHLGDGAVLATMRVERVVRDEGSDRCGFRFLYSVIVHMREAQEKVIWKFVLEQQRDERRRRRLEKQAG